MSNDAPFFPRRMVHLDFHTGPAVTDVGAEFDPVDFARTFQDAAVDSVTLFAKCHHGHLYYDTERSERHPGLSRDIHLLEKQVEALHSVGIRTPIYISVQCDEYAANTHPEWIALDENLQQVKWGDSAYIAGWQILDMSSPYQDYLADQISEVIEKFAPLDGVFLDMTWDQPSSSKWAKAAMKERGLDPADAADREAYARDLSHAYMTRYRDLIEPALSPEVASGVWFNSRPKTALDTETEFIRHVEIESLPSGGWGYAYFPYVSRFVRPYGLPTLSHTGRFYKSWGDNGGLKPHAALSYECAQILAQGMTSGVGDLLHPSGAVSHVTYDLVGSVYRHIRDLEPFVEDGDVVAEVAVLIDPALGDSPGSAGFGTVRALQQLRAQFDLVARTGEFDDYALVIIPETTVIDAELATKLKQFSDAGGAIFVSRGAAHGVAGAELLDFAGVAFEGGSPYSNVFLRCGDALGGPIGFDHVMYDRTLRMRATGDGEVLASIVEPYFEREWDHFSGHEYTPTSTVDSGWAAAVQVGRTVVAAAPLFEAFGNHAAPAYRDYIAAILGRLLPTSAVRSGGPVHLEIALTKTPSGIVAHLLSFLSTRAADGISIGHQGQHGLDLIEDPFPLVGMPLSIRSETRPSTVTLQPSGEKLDFDWVDGYVSTRVTVLNGHALVVVTI